jgi:hypothetical protein
LAMFMIEKFARIQGYPISQCRSYAFWTYLTNTASLLVIKVETPTFLTLTDRINVESFSNVATRPQIK